METAFFYLTIIFLVLFFIFYNLILIIRMRERCVVERLGKFRGVLEPGLHFLIPFVDRVAYRHETREQCINIPHQSCISRDNIQIDVDGLAMNANGELYGFEVLDGAASQLHTIDLTTAVATSDETRAPNMSSSTAV